MWKRIYRINWEGALKPKGRGWAPEGQMHELPKPLLRHHVERETCVFGERAM